MIYDTVDLLEVIKTR